MSDAHREEIAKLEALYAEHPEGRIFTHLAEAYRKSGLLDRARAVLEEGLARHPSYASAHVVLGRVLMDEERSEEAEAEFRRVLELDSHNLVALRSLGDLARARGDEGAALDFYRRLLDVEPADADVRGLVESLAADRPDAAETGAPQEATPFEEGAWSFSEPGAASESGAGSGVEPGTGLEGGAAANGAPEGFEEPEMGSGPEPESEPELATQPLTGFEPGPSFEAVDTEPFEALEIDRLNAGGSGGDPGAADLDTRLDTGEGEPGESDGTEAKPGGIEPAPESEPWSLGGSDDEAAEDAQAPSESPPGLMTETIAEVYARQGLYDRAAEVYRELVRSRPGEERLHERLDEMERLAQETRKFAPPPDPGAWSPWSREVDEGQERTGAGAGGNPEDTSVWTGAEWGESRSESPYSWGEEAGEADTSPPIRSYVRSLVEWTGAETPGPGAAAAEDSSETAGLEGGGEGGEGEMDASAADSGRDGGDDGLDTFRAWLESLKQ